jgi:hypothetical protein
LSGGLERVGLNIWFLLLSGPHKVAPGRGVSEAKFLQASENKQILNFVMEIAFFLITPLADTRRSP